MKEKTILEQRIDDGLAKLSKDNMTTLGIYQEWYLIAKDDKDKDGMYERGLEIRAYLFALRDCNIITGDNVEYLYFHFTH